MNSINITYLANLTEEQAFDLVAQMRWGNKPKCIHCGSTKKIYSLKVKSASRKILKCSECRKQFSALVGTIFEGSHIPLKKWLLAIHLMCSSKKGISANQLSRELDITYKSAWFMCHRIRWSFTQEPLDKLNGIVEVDETYIGKGKGYRGRGRNTDDKTPVVALIQRDGKAKSYKVDNVKQATLHKLIGENVEVTSDIMTDSFRSYKGLNKKFNSHEAVDHSKEYVRGICHTNFAESYFSLLKRGIVGTFHHVSKEHLDKYLLEFNHRWNSRKLTDSERTVKALQGIAGKRLTYKEPIQKAV